MSLQNSHFPIEIGNLYCTVNDPGQSKEHSTLSVDLLMHVPEGSDIHSASVTALLMDANANLVPHAPLTTSFEHTHSTGPIRIQLRFLDIPGKFDPENKLLAIDVTGYQTSTLPLANQRASLEIGSTLSGSVQQDNQLGIKWLLRSEDSDELFQARVSALLAIENNSPATSSSVGAYLRLADISRREIGYECNAVRPLMQGISTHALSIDSIDPSKLSRTDIEIGLLNQSIVLRSSQQLPVPRDIEYTEEVSVSLDSSDVETCCAWEYRNEDRYICRWLFVWHEIESGWIAGYFCGYSGGGTFSYEEFSARLDEEGENLVSFIYDGVDRVTDELAEMDPKSWAVATSCRDIAKEWLDEDAYESDQLILNLDRLDELEQDDDMYRLDACSNAIPALLSTLTPMNAGPRVDDEDDEDDEDEDEDEDEDQDQDEDQQDDEDQEEDADGLTESADQQAHASAGPPELPDPPGTINPATRILSAMRKYSWPKDFLLCPDIPEHRLSSALAAIAPDVPPQDIVAWVDMSFFGKPYGLLVSRRGLHARTVNSQPLEASYAGIRSIELQTSLLKRQFLVNGYAFASLDGCDKAACERLLDILQSHAITHKELQWK